MASTRVKDLSSARGLDQRINLARPRLCSPIRRLLGNTFCVLFAVAIFQCGACRALAELLHPCRLALTWFFTALCLLLFAWMELLAVQSFTDRRFLPRLRNVFFGVNGFVYVVMSTSMVLFAMYGSFDDREGSGWVYSFNIYLLAGTNFAISIAFAIYGRRLGLAMRHIDSSATERGQLTRVGTRILVVAVVFTCCFGLRFALLLYRPIANSYLPQALYYPLSYFVPELVPVTVQLVLYFRRIQRFAALRYQPKAARADELASSSAEFDHQASDGETSSAASSRVTAFETGSVPTQAYHRIDNGDSR